MEVIPGLILWLLLPAWILVGFLDWVFHRRSGIAQHCGPWESVLHLLQLGEAGVAVLIGLWLELNEPALALLLICFILHELTSYTDVRYAQARRTISPGEQRVHDYMTAIPVTALFLLAVLHWGSVQHLVGSPLRAFTEPLMMKANPLPIWQIVGILAAIFVVGGIPYLEELVRGIRARRRKSAQIPG